MKLVLRHIQITVFLLMEKKFLLIKRVGSRGRPPLSHYKLVRDTKKPVEEYETEYEDSDYGYDYDYGYTDEDLYAQGEDVTYGQDEYTEQTNNY